MNRSAFTGTHRFCLAVILIAVSSFLSTGCTRNQMQALLNSEDESEPATEEIVELPAAPVVKSRLDELVGSSDPRSPSASASAIDVDPGSGRDVTLAAGFRITPPATFNVISEQEGSDFRANYAEYRWERLSGGVWFIVTFLSGMDYEGDRTPKIQDERVVRQRIRSAFARVDEKHQLRSNGSQTERLAGLSTVRTNVIGQVEGEDAVGHLYLLSDGKHLIEIVALATEPNRSALKICRESANSLSRGPLKKQ